MVSGVLNTVITGERSDAPPLVIAHGLFGSARNWGVVAKRLSEGRQVVAVDMRNHGASPHLDRHGYREMADDLSGVIADLGGVADVMGHSMGGKAAMVLALARPELVGRLIVVDIAPVAYGHTQMPVIEAMRDVDLLQVTRRGEADAQMADRVEDPALRAFLLQSLALEEGVARWRLNLEVLADEMPRIMGFPEIAGVFEGEVDFVLGARSDYVAAEGWQAARRLFPTARRHVVPDAGHWVHAEAPKAFVELVSNLLSN